MTDLADTKTSKSKDDKQTQQKQTVATVKPSQIFNDYINTVTGQPADIMKDFLRSKMIIQDDRKNWHEGYNRLQFANHWDAFTGTREYLFFTKPKLHLYNKTKTGISRNKELSGDPFWREMYEYYARVMHALQSDCNRTYEQNKQVKTNEMDKQRFIAILTNASTGNLDLPTISAEMMETSNTIYGTSLKYRQASFASDEDFSFSLEFTDNKWLDVYHLFKIWNEYENLKSIGLVTPPGGFSDNNYYVRNKVLHDQIAIYRFVVDADDMETIVHYSKLFGCFPKSVPREAFSSVKEGLLNYSVDWQANFVEDMNPMILYEFNKLAAKYIGSSKAEDYSKTADLYYSNTGMPEYDGMIDGRWVRCPYIFKIKDSSRSTGIRYVLRWYTPFNHIKNVATPKKTKKDTKKKDTKKKK